MNQQLPQNADPSQGHTLATPVEIVARTIAGGIFSRHVGGKDVSFIRATLVLMPVTRPGKVGNIDLAAWPETIERLVHDGVTISVWALKSDAGRGVEKPTAIPITMAPLKHPASDKLNAFWQKVMGGTEGIAATATAITTTNNTLTKMLRSTNAPAMPLQQMTPDIHGTDRGVAALELSLERAMQILHRMASKNEDTRAAPKYPAPLNEAVAQQKLKESRQRADLIVKAQNEYLTAATPAGAIKSLLASQGHENRRAPEFCAKDLLQIDTAGPQLDAAHAAFILSSYSKPEDMPADFKPDEKNTVREFALRRMFALQAHPSLARLFRFVVDLEYPLDEFVEKLKKKPISPANYADPGVLDHDAMMKRNDEVPDPIPVPADPGNVTFLLMTASLPGAAHSSEPLPAVWTTAKLRIHQDDPALAPHFYPCTREEIDARAAELDLGELRSAAIAEQLDTLVDLGQTATCQGAREPRFDVVTLDAINATVSDYYYERSRALKADADDKYGTIPTGAHDEVQFARSTLRTMGMALIDRWHQSHAILRHISSSSQKEKAAGVSGNDAFKAGILLDASDVTIGYKLDVGVKSRHDPAGTRRRWHTLMRREVRFESTVNDWSASEPLDRVISGLYPDSLARFRADDGVLAVPSAVRDKLDTHSTAFTEEIIGAWRGDPLGLACVETQDRPVDSRDLRIGMTLALPKRTDNADYTPPPLRFGWRYYFGLRAVFAGGVSMPLERALSHYEKSYGGSLILPPASEPGRAFRRHERINAPDVAVPDFLFGSRRNGDTGRMSPVPGRFAAEQTRMIVVRSIDDMDNQRTLLNDSTAAKSAATARKHAPKWTRRVVMAPQVDLDFATMHGVFQGSQFESTTLFEPRVLREAEETPNGLSEETGENEYELTEWVAAAEADGKFWRKKRIAWRKMLVKSRPVGGLRAFDRRAAWGGLPIFRMQTIPTGPFQERENGTRVVESPPAQSSDLGEIVDRSETRTLKDRAGRRIGDIEWNAIEGVPTGTAVFRKLDPARASAPERLPYYPDPGVEALVITVTTGSGRSGLQVVPFYRKVGQLAKPAGYPDAMPVVLDTIAGAGVASESLIEFAGGRRDTLWSYGDDYDLRPLSATESAKVASGAVRHVRITLAPGETATIQLWCLPRDVFLKHIFEGTESVAALSVACGCVSPSAMLDPASVDDACRRGFETLSGSPLPVTADAGSDACGAGVGGLRLPSQSQIEKVATLIRDFLASQPVPEIASVLELSATHAVDIPQAVPAFVETDPKAEPLAILRVTDNSRQILSSEEGAKSAYPISTWNTLENHGNGATNVLLAGSVTLDAASTGAVEIQARGAAAARGVFDDPARGRSRDDRSRGLWPEVDPAKLFGFELLSNGKVSLQKETVTLLRLEGLSENAKTINLLDAQRKAHKEPGGALRALRPAAFPDAKARYIELYPMAVARHGGLLRTRYDELAIRLTRGELSQAKDDQTTISDTRLRGCWLPATVRPARVASLSLIPSFAWVRSDDATMRKEVQATRLMCIRVRLARPWFSSGEGERIGIVLWPPKLFELAASNVQVDVVNDLAPERGALKLNDLPDDSSGIREFRDADLGPGGFWVTRWGGDPIRPGKQPAGWLLSADNFAANSKDRSAGPSWEPPDAQLENIDWSRPPIDAPPDAAVVQDVLMPIPDDMDSGAASDDPLRGFLAVSLVTYEPRFDPEQEHWYTDVYINPLGVVSPFVRLGIVRFQPHAKRRLQVSEPVTEWIQILPTRTLKATAARERGASNNVRLTILLEGIASGRGDDAMSPETSSAQSPTVRFTLLKRPVAPDDERGEAQVAAAVAPSRLSDGGAQIWEWSISLEQAEFTDPRFSWSVYCEEVEQMRPASYSDEPRLETRSDTVFVETGPRFSAKLTLDGLR